MKLMTKELRDRFAKVGRQEGVEDPIVIAKFFNPTGVGTWYATEYYPEDNTIFGWADLGDSQNAEFGYTSLDELESFRGMFGLGIERDRYFGERKLSEAKGR